MLSLNTREMTPITLKTVIEHSTCAHRKCITNEITQYCHPKSTNKLNDETLQLIEAYVQCAH